MADVKQVMKEYAYQNIPLWYDLAYELGCKAIAACATDVDPIERIQSVATLSALHNHATYAHQGDGKSTPVNAAEQIAGFCAAVFEQDIARSQFGFAQPDVPVVMDNCGMGGDLVVTANVSTLAALIAAAGGIAMCKHGSPANADQGRHGSSDFVKLLGLKDYMSKAEVERMVAAFGFGYIEALDERFKRIHWQTHMYARLPHMNDIIGPITNPVNPQLMTRRVIGVNHLIDPYVVADAYRILNRKGVTNIQRLAAVRGYVSRGSQAGMDELSICAGGTKVAWLADTEIVVEYLAAGDLGLATAPVEAISPPAGISKGQFSLDILHREVSGPAVDMVLANAALLFHLDTDLPLAEACTAARDVYSTGAPAQLVERMQVALPATEHA